MMFNDEYNFGPPSGSSLDASVWKPHPPDLSNHVSFGSNGNLEVDIRKVVLGNPFREKGLKSGDLTDTRC